MPSTSRPLQLDYLDMITRGNNPRYEGNRTNLTNEQMASINAAVAQDPAWLAARNTPQAAQAYRAAFERAYGAPLGSIANLDDYRVDGTSGTITQRSWANRHPAAFAMLFGLGAAGAGAALGGAGGAGGGAAAGGSSAAGGALGSTSLATGSTAAGAGGLGAGAALPTAGAAGGGLAGGAGVTGGTVAAGGSGAATAGSRLSSLYRQGSQAASAYGQAQAQNRGTQLEATMDQDRTRLEAERDRRAGEREAMAGLARANYIQNWQPRQSSVPNLPTYGFGPQAPSEAQRQGAATLQQTLLDRLNTGGFQPTNTSNLMRPSGGERAAGWIGTGLSLYGAYSGNRGSSALGSALSNRASGGGSSAPSGGGSSTPSGANPSLIFQDQSGMDRWNNAINSQRANSIPVSESMTAPVGPDPYSYGDRTGMERWDEALRRQRGQR